MTFEFTRGSRSDTSPSSEISPSGDFASMPLSFAVPLSTATSPRRSPMRTLGNVRPPPRKALPSTLSGAFPSPATHASQRNEISPLESANLPDSDARSTSSLRVPASGRLIVSRTPGISLTLTSRAVTSTRNGFLFPGAPL